MEGRMCNKCYAYKEAEHFQTNGVHPNGKPRLRSICIECGSGRPKENVEPKVCKDCRKKKPASEFRQNGTYFICKPCQNERVAAPRRVGGKKHKWHVEYARRYRAKDPGAKLKAAARWAVYQAVHCGELVRPERCSCCNEVKKLEAHHHNGYRLQHWFEVTWLCTQCHNEEDRRLRGGD